LQTPENFRSLASTLLAARRPAVDEPGFDPSTQPCAEVSKHQGDTVDHHDTVDTADHNDTVVDEVCDDELELLRDVRLFHARIIEAVEAAVETLVADIAADVLGRELLLEAADIESIVDAALQRFSSEEPLRIRVNADDVSRVRCSVPVVADDRLRRGDAVLELRGGSVDASLGVRLASVIQAATA
jgi:Flagellar assembly protein FliH